jgi:hypothetical protein
MRQFLCALCLLTAGCSLLGEPASTSPKATLSKANLTAACDSKTNGVTQVWLSCTVLSQVADVCGNVAGGNPVDEQLISVINAFSPDPVLNEIGTLGVGAANRATVSWCASQGYNAPAKL